MNEINWERVWPEAGLGEYDAVSNTFKVYSLHVLTQLIGYAKFFYRNSGPVLFRGQSRDYGAMIPSLFRGSHSIRSVTKRQGDITKYVNKLIEQRVFIKRTESIAYEALLQHYGIKTRWLDLVDNIWIALWFATHEAFSIGSASKYIHYEINKNEYSYIYIMYFGKNIQKISRKTKSMLARLCRKEDAFNKFIQTPNHGYFETDSYQIIDLRYMTPSLYQRPHSQHALLVRRKSFPDIAHVNYQDSIIGVLEIETELALKWLGDGALSEVHFMFPPPTYDPGYKRFLDKNIDPDIIELGSIQHIGA